jgi:hypothetical protein
MAGDSARRAGASLYNRFDRERLARLCHSTGGPNGWRSGGAMQTKVVMHLDWDQMEK